MSSRRNVLVADGDSTWALSVITCLSQIEDYKLFVLSNTKRTATKYSKYTSYYKFSERGDDANWLKVINSEIEANDISIVIPIAEKEIAFFINHLDSIHSAAKVIPLPEFKDFVIATDKKLLSDFAITNDISHPKSFHVTSEKNKDEFFSAANFPVLIKPINLKGGDGIKKIDTLSNFPKQIEGPLFIQEYIEGYDVDCSVLCLKGKVLTHTIQKGNLKGHNDFAPQLGFNFLKNETLLKVVEDIMSKFNWSGVAHLDLRYDENTKDYKLIEINARFWGSVDASECAGINFPHLSIQLALNGFISEYDFETIHYMRLKGVLKSIKRQPTFIFKKTFLMNNTEAKSFLKDPLPTMYKFREWFGRRF
ncbi:hypothetical protein A9Q86_05265 [Flavobacteriales bacterium 33_180_T64]|mgnify:CR=1 FL=1|nr:hypothetical protein A9Q86_05265 [Flavobacteriales bacterium 33_180_T64]